MTAARTGRVEPVKLLLARGADVNARERKGQTALMWAAAEGHVEVIQALSMRRRICVALFRRDLRRCFSPSGRERRRP